MQRDNIPVPSCTSDILSNVWACIPWHRARAAANAFFESQAVEGVLLEHSLRTFSLFVQFRSFIPGLVISHFEQRETGFLGTCMPPSVVVPTRMRPTHTFGGILVVVQHWMFWVHASMTGAEVSRDVDGSVVCKTAAFAHQVLRLIVEERQEWKAELPSASVAA